jgi:hypothetical protein
MKVGHEFEYLGMPHRVATCSDLVARIALFMPQG